MLKRSSTISLDVSSDDTDEEEVLGLEVLEEELTIKQSQDKVLGLDVLKRSSQLNKVKTSLLITLMKKKFLVSRSWNRSSQ